MLQCISTLAVNACRWLAIISWSWLFSVCGVVWTGSGFPPLKRPIMASLYVHAFICFVDFVELAVNSWSELGFCVCHYRDSCVFSDPVSVTGNTVRPRAIAADSIDSIGQDDTRSNLIGVETGTPCCMVVFMSALTVKNGLRKLKSLK